MKGLLGSVRTLPAWLRARRARRPARAAAPPFRRKLLFEALEPRLLLSADLNPGAPDPSIEAPLVQTVDPQQTPNMAAVLSQQPAAKAIVFLDASLEQYRGELGDANVVLLDPDRDGVQQITEALASEHDVDSVHLIAHGSDQGIYLGQTQLGASTIDGYADQLATWSAALSTDADILLYGCDIGQDGNFLQAL